MVYDYIVMEGFVNNRSDVKGIEFDSRTQYIFTALVVDDQKLGHKINFPRSFDKNVIAGHRVHIEGSMAFSDGWFRMADGTVTDLGKVDFDPTDEFTFDVGYIPLPKNGLILIYNPKNIEGVVLVKTPVDLVKDQNDWMFSTWKVRGIRTKGRKDEPSDTDMLKRKRHIPTDRIRVCEILSVTPITHTRTIEMSLRLVRFGNNGLSFTYGNDTIHIDNSMLEFESKERLNLFKKQMRGTIKVGMEYRRRGRWNNQTWSEQIWIEPMAPLSVQFPNPDSKVLINRFLEMIKNGV